MRAFLASALVHLDTIGFLVLNITPIACLLCSYICNCFGQFITAIVFLAIAAVCLHYRRKE